VEYNSSIFILPSGVDDFQLGKMRMRSWQLAPSYLGNALIKSFVRLSIPQPHSLIGLLLQAPAAKHICEIPIPSLASRLDPEVCLLNDELSSSSSLRHGAYALI
jgi:hypothetical protein